MRRSLTRPERLKKKADFARVFDEPDFKSSCRGAKFAARRNQLDINRIGIALVRKFGHAVERNYARRVLKEIYRNQKQNLQTGYDIVIVLYPGDYGYQEREQQFMEMLQRAGFGL